MNYAFAVAVADGAEDLPDEILAEGLRIMVLRLLVEAIKKLASGEALEDEVDLLGGFVDLLESDDVGVVKLDEDLDFLLQLGEGELCRDGVEVEALRGVEDAGLSVLDLAYDAGDAGTDYASGVDCRVDLCACE